MRPILLYSILALFFIGACKESTPEWQRIDIGFNDNFHDIAPIDKNKGWNNLGNETLTRNMH